MTERLGNRVQDISYWKFELERSIQDISAENDLMVQEIRRLEYAIQATEVPKSIGRWRSFQTLFHLIFCSF